MTFVYAESWKNLFVDEMRRRGASGREVGEAWATIEAHCTETGQSATEAFGDPVDYAAALAREPRNPLNLARPMLAILLAVLASYMTPFTPWRWGQSPPLARPWPTRSSCGPGRCVPAGWAGCSWDVAPPVPWRC